MTGGAGYVGSHAVKALVDAGYEVVVYDDLSAGHREATCGLPLVVGNILETDGLRQAIRQWNVKAVLHFAASLSVAQSVRDPVGYYRQNVTGTLSLLEAMAAESIQFLILSSTAAVYGDPLETPIIETHPTKPINTYGETKLAVERALPHFGLAYGLRSISLRYFNAAGADPDGNLGEEHSPELHLIPRAINAALEGRKLQIFGNDYSTADGTCLRDYVHVTDLANAHVLALSALEADKDSSVYNLGNGRPISVLEVVRAVERVTGSKICSNVVGRRSGDPAILTASSEKIKRELGWQPQYEELEQIVETAWRWRVSHPHGFKSRQLI